jgi:hypothetical protein
MYVLPHVVVLQIVQGVNSSRTLGSSSARKAPTHELGGAATPPDRGAILIGDVRLSLLGPLILCRCCSISTTVGLGSTWLLCLVGADGSLRLVLGLESLGQERQLQEVIHLGLGALHVLLLDPLRERGEGLVGLLLALQGLAVVSQLVVGMGDCLIAGHYLQVVLAKEGDVPVKALEEAVYSCLEVLEVLIHEP